MDLSAADRSRLQVDTGPDAPQADAPTGDVDRRDVTLEAGRLDRALDAPQAKPDQAKPDQAKPDQAKPDQAKPKVDRALPDKASPDRPPKKSCQERYGQAASYLLCQETATTCRFNANIKIATAAGTCEALCAQYGGTCLAAYDNPDGAGNECTALSTPDTCATQRTTEICVCSR